MEEEEEMEEGNTEEQRGMELDMGMQVLVVEAVEEVVEELLLWGNRPVQQGEVLDMDKTVELEDNYKELVVERIHSYLIAECLILGSTTVMQHRLI
uniref:Uncharacterized protein n=1 Tax=Syphacia muris TaxID=451379 RepID=A0A0N5AT22_9BILA